MVKLLSFIDFNLSLNSINDFCVSPTNKLFCFDLLWEYTAYFLLNDNFFIVVCIAVSISLLELCFLIFLMDERDCSPIEVEPSAIEPFNRKCFGYSNNIKWRVHAKEIEFGWHVQHCFSHFKSQKIAKEKFPCNYAPLLVD